MNGSPEYCGGQLQMGLWLTTSHLAPTPQAPGHGFRHFWLLQASLRPQSELTIHSGRQDGGLPIKPITHEQTAWSLTSRHMLWGPQGDGLQGCTEIGAANNKKKKKPLWAWFSYDWLIWTENSINIQKYPGTNQKRRCHLTLIKKSMRC